ncbi:hypothetical protein [Carboxylicivirga marina]|uniref:hypothetical protein n=1 Tax=Carboxylicivirga marina TaxID=2800988 RepID=UPI0025925348|nr:hypothetical protein [uncultured Carboxylicivirga sp.]
MRRLIVFGILSILFFAVPTLVLCQEMALDVPLEILTPQTYYGTLLSLTGFIVLVTAFVNKWLKIKKKWGKQFLSWGVALLLGAIGKLLGWGIMSSVGWELAMLYSFLAALCANGAHTIAIVKNLLQLLKLEVKVE